MTQEISYYTTNEERKHLIADAESRQLTLQHDDFRVGPNGANRLTFDVVEITVDTNAVRAKELVTKLKVEDLTLTELNELSRLEKRSDP